MNNQSKILDFNSPNLTASKFNQLILGIRQHEERMIADLLEDTTIVSGIRKCTIEYALEREGVSPKEKIKNIKQEQIYKLVLDLFFLNKEKMKISIKLSDGIVFKDYIVTGIKRISKRQNKNWRVNHRHRKDGKPRFQSVTLVEGSKKRIFRCMKGLYYMFPPDRLRPRQRRRT